MGMFKKQYTWVLIKKEVLFAAISVKTHSICKYIFITHIFTKLIY